MVLTGFGRGPAHHPADRGAPADARRRARARRQRRRSTSTPSRPSCRSAGGTSTACCTRSPSRPPDALGGRFLQTPSESALTAFQTSAFSLKALAAGAAAAAAGRARRRVDRGPGLRRHRWPGRSTTGRAWPRRRSNRSAATWRATSVRSASAATWSPPARSARWPRATSRASRCWRAPGWSRRRWAGTCDDPSPVADACVFLLSDLARAITGEILHVDGGVHAIGAAAAAAAADVQASAAPEPAALPGGRRQVSGSCGAGRPQPGELAAQLARLRRQRSAPAASWPSH